MVTDCLKKMTAFASVCSLATLGACAPSVRSVFLFSCGTEEFWVLTAVDGDISVEVEGEILLATGTYRVSTNSTKELIAFNFVRDNQNWFLTTSSINTFETKREAFLWRTFAEMPVQECQFSVAVP